MSNTSGRHWSRWRIAPVVVAAAAATAADPVAAVPRLGRRPVRSGESVEPVGRPEAGPDGRRQEDGTRQEEDDIRQELVERVRREIAAGTYDTEDRWLAAEAELLRRVAGRT